MDTMHELQQLVVAQKMGIKHGICSVCSGSPFVLEAALLQAKETGTSVLIEATANQVNQFGGYTGQTPADFFHTMEKRAEVMGFPRERLLLGGDHLGPVAWQKEPAVDAMAKAETLVHDFAAAGYTKIHLDASMPLADDTDLTTEEIARRAAFLCKAAERGAAEYHEKHPDALRPVYVIGSEVPTPGGAGDEEGLAVTKPQDLLMMLAIFEKEFKDNGLSDAWKRVVAAVVQPGVEFGNDSVHAYVPEEAAELTKIAQTIPQIVLEGHSTDYQTEADLRNMVEDGIAILKVGPALTFAAREALYALSYIEDALAFRKPSGFRDVLEEAMLEDPKNWRGHYTQKEPLAKQLRMFSYSDRSRYYMTAPQVQAAQKKLFSNLKKTEIPLSMLSQYLPVQYQKVRNGELENAPRALVLDKVREVLQVYWKACGLV